MSYYYWFNRKDLLKKAYDNKGGKEKAAKYYQKNEEMIKERERNEYKMMSKEEKNKIKERSLKRYYRLKAQYKELTN